MNNSLRSKLLHALQVAEARLMTIDAQKLDAVARNDDVIEIIRKAASEPKQPDSPISSGWRGDLSGHIAGTESRIEVSEITLKLDRKTAYALCNVLYDGALNEPTACLEDDQRKALSQLGAALGRLVDHSAANNGGRELVKN